MSAQDDIKAVEAALAGKADRDEALAALGRLNAMLRERQRRLNAERRELAAELRKEADR